MIVFVDNCYGEFVEWHHRFHQH
ncbi:hypothetical protein [Staphylococcus pseudintermedius]